MLAALQVALPKSLYLGVTMCSALGYLIDGSIAGGITIAHINITGSLQRLDACREKHSGR